jgi:hypothetical protein
MAAASTGDTDPELVRTFLLLPVGPAMTQPTVALPTAVPTALATVFASAVAAAAAALSLPLAQTWIAETTSASELGESAHVAQTQKRHKPSSERQQSDATPARLFKQGEEGLW